MKIAVIGSRGFPGVQGGVENHCEKLYTQLVKLGCIITVFVRKKYVDSDLRTHKGVSLIPVSSPGNKYLEAFMHTLMSLPLAFRLKPDILHIHAIGPSWFSVFARILGMKVVVTNHGPDYLRKKWPLPARAFLRFCEMTGAKSAHAVIAIADNIADDLKLKYGIDVNVIPNGVEIPGRAETDNMLKKLGLLRRRYLLAVGRLVPEKGFDYLINAFNSLQDARLEDWKLVIAGRADHEDKYSRDLKMLAGRNRNIILTGFLTGIPLHELYSHAGLFVLPSYYEGLPIALLEAMSYGLSCIASDIPANRNIELAETRFFKTGDVQGLASKIKEFINTLWKREDEEKQIKLIAEKYSWIKIADETLKVYRNVVS
jgi:glycosyltransferase involved in cell wall biosynthesis